MASLPKNYFWRVNTLRDYRGQIVYRISLMRKSRVKIFPSVPIAYDYVFTDSDSVMNQYNENETVIEAVRRVKSEIYTRFF